MSANPSSTTRTGGFSVRGIHFKSPDDARAAARRLRQDADEHAAAFRREGRDDLAEKVVDQSNEQADAYDLAATEHDTKRSKVAQRPAAKRGGAAASSSGQRARRSPRPSRGRGNSGGLFGGVGSKTVAASTGSAGDVIEQLILATIAVAFLSVFLNARGASAFDWLAGGVSRLVDLLIRPVDPLGSFGTAPDTASATAAQETALGKSTGITPAKRKKSPVVVTTGRGGHS